MSDYITNIKDARTVLMRNSAGVTFEGKTGASKCVACGKAMPVCWDVVCSVCGGTFCYEHAKAKGGRWFCLGCA